MTSLDTLAQNIVACEKCPRLRNWCQQVAIEKRKMFQDQDYWGKPVPGFGDSNAKILIVGLAPAAHGANRTGRMFTGDRSGMWLFRALHKAGLSNQNTYQTAKDGLHLKQSWITNMVRCAPPQNKPSLQEKKQCFAYYQQELALLTQIKVIITLGGIAWDGVWKAFRADPGQQSGTLTSKPKFGHGVSYQWDRYTVIGSYHPSQQNTFTKRLSEEMFDDIFTHAKSLT